MTLESTQPLTEMSTRKIPGGGGGVKRGRHVRLTTLLPTVSRLYIIFGSHDLTHTNGPSRPGTGIALLYLLLLLSELIMSGSSVGCKQKEVNAIRNSKFRI
jgi:hypothetical protein